MTIDPSIATLTPKRTACAASAATSSATCEVGSFPVIAVFVDHTLSSPLLEPNLDAMLVRM